MAPQLNDADFQVLVSCIKNSPTKLAPNFDQVAIECGCKDSRAAYMRHWSVMKKLGLTGTKLQSQKPKKAAAASAKKRGATGEAEAAAVGDGVDGEGVVGPETPTKKAKNGD